MFVTHLYMATICSDYEMNTGMDYCILHRKVSWNWWSIDNFHKTPTKQNTKLFIKKHFTSSLMCSSGGRLESWCVYWSRSCVVMATPTSNCCQWGHLPCSVVSAHFLTCCVAQPYRGIIVHHDLTITFGVISHRADLLAWWTGVMIHLLLFWGRLSISAVMKCFLVFCQSCKAQYYVHCRYYCFYNFCSFMKGEVHLGEYASCCGTSTYRSCTVMFDCLVVLLLPEIRMYQDGARPIF